MAPAVRYLAHRWRDAVDCSLELSHAARYARAGPAKSGGDKDASINYKQNNNNNNNDDLKINIGHVYPLY